MSRGSPGRLLVHVVVIGFGTSAGTAGAGADLLRDATAHFPDGGLDLGIYPDLVLPLGNEVVQVFAPEFLFGLLQEFIMLGLLVCDLLPQLLEPLGIE